jgi:hypothetical protein
MRSIVALLLLVVDGAQSFNLCCPLPLYKTVRGSCPAKLNMVVERRPPKRYFPPERPVEPPMQREATEVTAPEEEESEGNFFQWLLNVFIDAFPGVFVSISWSYQMSSSRV